MNKFLFHCSFVLILLFIITAGTADEEYETPLIVQARDVVPAELLTSDLYEIDSDVLTRGYTNTYEIRSEYGDFTAHGNDMLAERIQEIKAIHELDKIKESDAFEKGVKNTASSPFKFLGNLVTHPIDTVTGVPEGLWRYGSRVVEMVGGPEKSEYEDSMSKELILFSTVKRKLAYDLNVNVYSSNKALQERLNSVSWATYSGGMVVSVAMAPLRAVRLTKSAQNVNNLVRDNSPEDLNRLNREKLEKLNVPEDVIDAFQGNAWISPRHETTIVHMLEYQGLTGGITDFLQLATTASSEEEAFFFQNIVELTQHYLSNTVESSAELVIHDNFTLLRVRKHFVFPLLVDNGYWSEFGAKLINQFESDIRSKYGQDVQILLWITGEVSNRAKKELKARKIILVEHAFSTIGKNI